MADLVKFAPFILFGFFMLFTIKDLILSQFSNEANSKEIPGMNFSPSKNKLPTLKIVYCYSCGYRNAFDQYVDILSKRFPDILIHGSTYPPPLYNTILARFLSLAKLFILLCIVTGANLSRYLGRLAPTWSWCISNRLYSFAMILLICNMIEGHLEATGAFEISFNDVPIWSKIETGRIPQPPELFQIIENQILFQGYTLERRMEIPY